MSETEPPIVLLAFANDRQLGGRYLPNLNDEGNQVFDILHEAEKKGLCKVLRQDNITPGRLVQLFQENDRIAVFHYGGHADNDELLLVSEDGSPQPAKGQWLAQFLGEQSLRFVFLNGCSTAGLGQQLMEQGIPAALTTSSKINDAAATAFAIAFYTELADGKTSLATAFKVAEGAANLQGIQLWRGGDDFEERLPEAQPWALYPPVATGDGFTDDQAVVWTLSAEEETTPETEQSVEALPELELSISKTESGTCRVELISSDPEDEKARPVVESIVDLALDELIALASDTDQYGEKLTNAILSREEIRSEYLLAREKARPRRPLRIRFLAESAEAGWKSVRWELMKDPVSGLPLAQDPALAVSRLAPSEVRRGRGTSVRDDLRALLLTKDPGNSLTSELAELDIEVVADDRPVTLQRLKTGLSDFRELVVLAASPSPGQPLPSLVLQDEAGTPLRVGGQELVQTFRELNRPPRLLILSSAGISEGTSDDWEDAGPALADLLVRDGGIPAVIALQAPPSPDSEEALRRFEAALLRDLLEHGQIDRALQGARQQLPEPDRWKPILTTSLSKGIRLWSGPTGHYESWPALCQAIEAKKVVPILGPDFGEKYWGLSRQIAQSLAEAHDLPLGKHERSDLPRVLQFMSVKDEFRSVEDARDSAIELFLRQLAHERRRRLKLATDGSDPKAEHEATIEDASRERNPHRILADLEQPVYITAGYDSVLESVIAKRRGVDVGEIALVIPWRKLEETEKEKDDPQEPQPDQPSAHQDHLEDPRPDRPYVYHVFGDFSDFNSIVATEDDYFDYLIAAPREKLIPDKIFSKALRGSMVFLGFRLDDWRFRVLFRLLMSAPGSEISAADERCHVGVQIDPDESDLEDVEAAKKFFQRSLEKPVKITIYWGTARSYLRELQGHLQSYRSSQGSTPRPRM